MKRGAPTADEETMHVDDLDGDPEWSVSLMHVNRWNPRRGQENGAVVESTLGAPVSDDLKFN